MSVEILDGSTVRSFVEDDWTKAPSTPQWTAGSPRWTPTTTACSITYAEMAGEAHESSRVLEKHFGRFGVDEAAVAPDELAGLYRRGLFARFNRDGSGKVDMHEFRAEMKEVMLAVANGLGFLPVQMVLDEGSFLKVAVDRELGQLAKAA